MKTMTKVVLSSAVLAGAAAAAHAQTVPVPDPSTDASELIFIVQSIGGTNSGDTYDLVLNAGTGTASNSYLTSAQVNSPGVAAVDGTSAGVIYGDAGFSVSLAGDSALSTFISTAGGASNVRWGVMGGAYIGGATNATLKKVGNVLIATTGTAGSIVSVGETGLLDTITVDLSTDIKGLNGGSFDAFDGVTNGFPASPGTDNQNFDLYGNGVVQGAAVGSTNSLYGITGNGTTANDGLAYLLGTFTFNGTTLSFTGEQSAVPIPAAGWLLGSGLLGLLGISRRRRDPVAA